MTTVKQSKKNKAKSTIKLPAWFNLQNYHKANQLDLEGWIIQLYLRNMIKGFMMREVLTGVVDDYTIPENNHKEPPHLISPVSLHDAILIAEGLKTSMNIPAETWQSPSIFKSMSADNSLLSWCSQTNGVEHLSKTALTSCANYSVLQKYTSVDLSAPDAVLIASFKQWLKDRRASMKEYPHCSFSDAILRRWAMNQILPYMDLIYWAELNQVHIPHWLMGDTLFPGDNQGDKVDRVRKTTEKVAKEVIQDSCIYGMAAQLKFETGRVLDLGYFFTHPYLETKNKIFIPPQMTDDFHSSPFNH